MQVIEYTKAQQTSSNSEMTWVIRVSLFGISGCKVDTMNLFIHWLMKPLFFIYEVFYFFFICYIHDSFAVIFIFSKLSCALSLYTCFFSNTWYHSWPEALQLVTWMHCKIALFLLELVRKVLHISLAQGVTGFRPWQEILGTSWSTQSNVETKTMALSMIHLLGLSDILNLCFLYPPLQYSVFTTGLHFVWVICILVFLLYVNNNI